MKKFGTDLFVEFVHNALSPLEVQIFAFERPVDVSQLDAHLTHQEPVVFIGPVNPRTPIITNLGEGDVQPEISILLTGIARNHPKYILAYFLILNLLFFAVKC